MPIRKLLERNALYIAIFITVLIAFLSLVSLRSIHVIKVSHSDKYGHFIAYFVLSLSWFFFYSNYKKKIKKYIISIFIISYGIILEVLQGLLTTYRQADVYDFLANSVGVILAAILFEKLNRFF